jgi:hypothetical protein
VSNTNGRDEHSRPGDESDIIVFGGDAAKARSTPVLGWWVIRNPHEHCRGACKLGECTFYHFAPRMSVIPAQAGIHRRKLPALPTRSNPPDCLSHQIWKKGGAYHAATIPLVAPDESFEARGDSRLRGNDRSVRLSDGDQTDLV